MLKPNPTAQDCIAVLAELVKFDTTSRNSNLELIEFVREQLDAIGIGSRLTFNDEKTKANLWATIGPDIEGGVVLSGHTDVVPVDGQNWSSDPFELTERDGRLFARGTCDMKGFVACALAHAQSMANADLKVPVHFAFSYDEEVGCVGVKGLIKDMQENLPKPLAVIVGEPTSMQIVGAHKGGHSFVTTVRGLDGHSSAPDLGANAIFYAARILTFIEKLRERIKADGDPTNGFNPYYTTVDCGVINGGTARNIIPAVCEFSWGFRNVPGDDTHAFAQEVFDFIEKEINSMPDLDRIPEQIRNLDDSRNDELKRIQAEEKNVLERSTSEREVMFVLLRPYMELGIDTHYYRNRRISNRRLRKTLPKQGTKSHI